MSRRKGRSKRKFTSSSKSSPGKTSSSSSSPGKSSTGGRSPGKSSSKSSPGKSSSKSSPSKSSSKSSPSKSSPSKSSPSKSSTGGRSPGKTSPSSGKSSSRRSSSSPSKSSSKTYTPSKTDTSPGSTTNPYQASQPDQSAVSPYLKNKIILDTSESYNTASGDVYISKGLTPVLPSSSKGQVIQGIYYQQYETQRENAAQSQYESDLVSGNVGLAQALLQPKSENTFYGDDTRNIKLFLEERGYDISKPETIPDSVFSPSKNEERRQAAKNPIMVDLEKFEYQKDRNPDRSLIKFASPEVQQQRAEATTRYEKIKNPILFPSEYNSNEKLSGTTAIYETVSPTTKKETDNPILLTRGQSRYGEKVPTSQDPYDAWYRYSDKVDAGLVAHPRDTPTILDDIQYYFSTGVRPIYNPIFEVGNLARDKPIPIQPTTAGLAIGGLIESGEFALTGGKSGSPLEETMPKVWDYISEDPIRFLSELPAEVAMALTGGKAIQVGAKGLTATKTAILASKAPEPIKALVKVGDKIVIGKQLVFKKMWEHTPQPLIRANYLVSSAIQDTRNKITLISSPTARKNLQTSQGIMNEMSITQGERNALANWGHGELPVKFDKAPSQVEMFDKKTFGIFTEEGKTPAVIMKYGKDGEARVFSQWQTPNQNPIQSPYVPDEILVHGKMESGVLPKIDAITTKPFDHTIPINKDNYFKVIDNKSGTSKNVKLVDDLVPEGVITKWDAKVFSEKTHDSLKYIEDPTMPQGNFSILSSSKAEIPPPKVSKVKETIETKHTFTDKDIRGTGQKSSDIPDGVEIPNFHLNSPRPILVLKPKDIVPTKPKSSILQNVARNIAKSETRIHTGSYIIGSVFVGLAVKSASATSLKTDVTPKLETVQIQKSDLVTSQVTKLSTKQSQRHKLGTKITTISATTFPPIVPTIPINRRRPPPLIIWLPSTQLEEKKSKQQAKKPRKDFRGNVRLDNIMGVYGKRSTITYSKKKITKYAAIDSRITKKTKNRIENTTELLGKIKKKQKSKTETHFGITWNKSKGMNFDTSKKKTKTKGKKKNIF